MPDPNTIAPTRQKTPKPRHDPDAGGASGKQGGQSDGGTHTIAQRPIGPNERLSATLVLSAALIGVLILGIGFSRDESAPVVPTLDVILTPTRTDAAPDSPDFIAQANNRGGGDRDRAQRPRDNQMAVAPQPDPGVAPEVQVLQAPPPEPEAVARVLTSSQAAERTLPTPEEQQALDPLPLPSGRELIQQSLEMARLAADIERQQQLYAKRPRRKFVSASTQEYAYASYMRSWIAKVERIGNLNYPDEARRRGLSGRLVMTVVVRRDGSVDDVILNEPSGQSLLDDAALRTVRLAEPFQALPETDEHVELLHITRTWEFTQGGVSSN